MKLKKLNQQQSRLYLPGIQLLMRIHPTWNAVFYLGTDRLSSSKIYPNIEALIESDFISVIGGGGVPEIPSTENIGGFSQRL